MESLNKNELEKAAECAKLLTDVKLTFKTGKLRSELRRWIVRNHPDKVHDGEAAQLRAGDIAATVRDCIDRMTEKQIFRDTVVELAPLTAPEAVAYYMRVIF